MKRPNELLHSAGARLLLISSNESTLKRIQVSRLNLESPNALLNL